MKNIATILLLTTIVVNSQEKQYEDKIYQKPKIVKEAPSNFLSPEESMKTFYLPKGFKAELVVSEPMINEPVTFAWDGDGKMYVAEMATYMQDVDGTGRDQKTSQIKLLVDTDGDGKMDKSTVFIDNLLLPRMIMPLGDCLIVNETYSYDLWSYRDTDGDGVADEKKRVFHKPEKRGGNMEHQQSGLIWNLDNYVYTTYNPMRFRFKKDTVLVDKLYNMPSGQWGLTQDDMGHMYYSAAGGENPAYGFQQPAVYGQYDPPGRLEGGFMKPWPIVGTPDVQGGAKRLREDGTLNHFTGVAGQEVYRGHKLPSFMYGDVFIPEPVGRLVRRAKVKNVDGKKVLSNAYDKAEFMASTDLNFRPIQAKTGPDGALYVLDMYRGIIQESAWTRKGSKIRPVIVRKKLDKNIGKGRIYRIVHEDIKPDAQPKLMSKSAMELIPYLGHPNGWYRITAQKSIVVKEDLSVVEKLKAIALGNQTATSTVFKDKKDLVLERIHALWTLEGLGKADKELIFKAFEDADVRVQKTAIRLSEALLKSSDADVIPNLKTLAAKGNLEVNNQIALSLMFSKDKQSTEFLKGIRKRFNSSMIVRHSVGESLKKDDDKLQKLKKKIQNRAINNQKQILAGYNIYNQLCVTCHGADLKGAANEDGSLNAAPLIGSPRVRNQQMFAKVLLNGLMGKIDGEDYGIMMSLKGNNNHWMANVMSYVRAMNNWSNVNHRLVKKVRLEDKDREDFWTIKSLNKHMKKKQKNK